jgi:glutamate N-acetyltransferase/amino-acid N-acetyltransferase
MDKLVAGCKDIKKELGNTIQHAETFARSIMTTDTKPKWASAKVGDATILAFAKGAGMIEPNMATMLCYIISDADIEANKLKEMLTHSVNKSFNRISIDSDTSTSDTVAIMANGLAGTVDLDSFQKELDEICIYLAKEIVRDGEGATKLIELLITGAETREQAILTARSVINSPLIKTALYGADPNWGRFVMAIGKVFNYHVNIKDLKIFFGSGKSRKMIDAKTIDEDSVDLDAISALLKNDEIYIEIQLGNGQYSERVWGCDLTEGYIEENAFYTT